MDKFVKNIHQIKIDSSDNNTKRSIAKLYLNSLIGRFGMNHYKSITRLVDYDRHIFLVQLIKIFVMNLILTIKRL